MILKNFNEFCKEAQNSEDLMLLVVDNDAPEREQLHLVVFLDGGEPCYRFAEPTGCYLDGKPSDMEFWDYVSLFKNYSYDVPEEKNPYEHLFEEQGAENIDGYIVVDSEDAVLDIKRQPSGTLMVAIKR